MTLPDFGVRAFVRRAVLWRPWSRRRTLSSVVLALIASSLLVTASQTANQEISILWKRPLKPPASFTVAPGGRFFGVVGQDETVCVYDKAGHVIWKKQVKGATDVLIAKNGMSFLIYSKLNPRQTGVYFYRRDGTLLWTHRPRGSIWAGAVSPDGSFAAVGTGQRYLYRYSPDPKRPRYRSWRLDGIGHSITFTPDSRRMVIGTWQQSTVVCYDVDGKFLWRYRLNSNRQYDLQASADGRTILGVRPGSQHTPETELCLWSSDGKLLWRRKIDGFDPAARISPGSKYVAVSYANYLTHKRSTALERKIAVFGTRGNLLWQKGGLFFSPRLVSLSPTGASAIVSDGRRSFYNIDRNGRILSKLRIGGSIRSAIPSDDSRCILVYCGDGWMYMLSVGT